MKNHDDRSIYIIYDAIGEERWNLHKNFFDCKLNSNNKNSENSKLIETPQRIFFFYTANIPYIFHMYIYHSFRYPSPTEILLQLNVCTYNITLHLTYIYMAYIKYNAVNVKLNKGIFMQKFTRNDYISTLQFYTSTPFRQ